MRSLLSLYGLVGSRFGIWSYNTCQKSWDTLHIFNLDETFVPLLPLKNVGFWEKYMGKWKNFSCAIMPSVSGTDQHCFRGKGDAFKA